MKAKEYLQQIFLLDTAINQKLREVSALRLKVQSIGSVDYSKDRIMTSASGNAVFVKLTERIIDLEKEINAEIDNFVRQKNKIINQIQKSENACYADLLFKRYVEYKSLERISIEMNYSYDRIRHMHADALENFQDKFLIDF